MNSSFVDVSHADAGYCLLRPRGAFPSAAQLSAWCRAYPKKQTHFGASSRGQARSIESKQDGNTGKMMPAAFVNESSSPTKAHAGSSHVLLANIDSAGECSMDAEPRPSAEEALPPSMAGYRGMTVMSLEVTFATRGDLMPDPKQDPIVGLAWAVQSDDLNYATGDAQSNGPDAGRGVRRGFVLVDPAAVPACRALGQASTT